MTNHAWTLVTIIIPRPQSPQNVLHGKQSSDPHTTSENRENILIEPL